MTSETLQSETGFFKKSVSFFCLAASSLLLILFVSSHTWRSDGLMLATTVPLFLWIIVGLSLAIFIPPNFRRALFAGWLIAAAVLGDAPQSLLRGLIPAADPNNTNSIRVIALNCQSSIESAKECAVLEPDLVLFSESPSRPSLEAAIESDFPGYSLIWSPDTTLLVRGTAEPLDVPRKLTSQYVLATVRLTNGPAFNVASLRLLPSPVRIDIWNPAAWNELSANRVKRRAQLLSIYHQIKTDSGDQPTLVGGDFNAPARDAIFEILRPDLRDGFVAGGRGWGKTIVNQWPVHRIDQIWISHHFRAQSVTAKKTVHSDHRMVIGDYHFDDH